MTPGPGELIYQERRRRGWSKPRLCDEIQAWEYQHGNGDVLGLNPNYVREWESGERSVSDYYAPKLSAVLGIPLGTFVDRRTRRGRAAGPSKGRQREPAPAMATTLQVRWDRDSGRRFAFVLAAWALGCVNRC
jgi:transcriptional regulator with XRE-family HTH domain